MPRRFLPRQVLNILNLLLRTRKTYSRFFSVDYPQYFYLEQHLTKDTDVIQQKNNNGYDSYGSSSSALCSSSSSTALPSSGRLGRRPGRPGRRGRLGRRLWRLG